MHGDDPSGDVRTADAQDLGEPVVERGGPTASGGQGPQGLFREPQRTARSSRSNSGESPAVAPISWRSGSSGGPVPSRGSRTMPA
ncbi:hypothetical protein ACIQXD_00400 [Streptomyces uncialis]|uniref:hypothetical protein n=1 Tax=Streptomyces uncialis TaxID=1048205 RepID=UPI0038014779